MMKQGNSSERASAENANVPYGYIAFTRDDGQEVVQGVLEAPTEELAEQALRQEGYTIASLKAVDSRRYEYIAFARDGDGQEVRGVLEAASEELAEQSLWGSGYIIASLKAVDRRRYKYIAFTRYWQEVRGVLEAASEELAEQALWESDYIIATLKPIDPRPYEYVVLDQDGEEVQGVLEAGSEELAEQALWREGYIIASLKPVGRGPSLAGLMRSFLGVKLRDAMFLCLVLVMFLGLYFVRTQGPFMPVAGRSMEPTLRLFDLILIKGIAPQEVKEGDIIVFNVSPILQESYNYPAVVAHRVIEVDASGGAPAFRTKGDNNTGEDPFTVLPRDLRGKLYKSIAYLGFLPLFLQSRQGLYFMIGATILIGLYQYSEELDRGRKGLQRALFAPIIEEQARNSQEIQQRVESVGQALGQFASATSEYAAHPQSHTAAVKAPAQAAEELLQVIIDLAVEIIDPAETGLIHILDEASGELHPRALSGKPLGGLRGRKMRIGEGIAGYALEQGKAINVPDVNAEPRFLRLSGDPGFKSLLVVPLMLGQKRIGTLSVDSERVGAFDEDDEQLLTTLGTAPRFRG